LVCVANKSKYCSYNNDWYNDSEETCASPCNFANNWSWWLCFCILVLLYLVECYTSSSRKYLTNEADKESVFEYVDRMKQNAPQIWWKVECYHYETRVRTVTRKDANGHERTHHETYQEKVTTWRASDNYKYRSWEDVSTLLVGMDEYLLTKLSLYKTFSFANEQTRFDYESKAAYFRMINNRDVHQSFHWGIEIDGFQTKILAEVQPGVKPPCLSSRHFWIFSLLGLTVFYRWWFEAQCGRKKLVFNKCVSI